ncbi:endonuclease III domain-containing protein [Desulfobulbus oligotrophicus]|uniref:Endonuclease III domain-containing protein n=1 Tax=Desulfobulbus oligotrophicus TaxID=1909699 RepID=A0A7T6APL2_9BACT|nr:endonuclease III domain-containing protein [Desulfobulbus oligotrophicus]QQG64475.1 endonuclease III domain-containing protein [Desulfobulbus oligotrophicus]
MRTAERLSIMYDRLLSEFGPQHWWPADSALEVAVGAILTQNTSWSNVERAIANLKTAGLMSLEALSSLPTGLLAEYIRPSGYYNVKAGRLHNLLALINEHHNGSLDDFLDQPLPLLRTELLSVKGIGRETADTILLYAAHLPIFVVDAYTHRILVRHEVVDPEYDYESIQELFMDHLPNDPALFNEYHALLVCAGKKYCKKSKPDCSACPLEGV